MTREIDLEELPPCTKCTDFDKSVEKKKKSNKKDDDDILNEEEIHVLRKLFRKIRKVLCFR